MEKPSLVDFYQVLGVTDKTASQKDIKLKYTKLAIKYHPDKQTDSSNKNQYVQLFELIQKAWSVLGNEEKRKQYDLLMSNIDKNRKNDHLSLKKSYEEYSELVTTTLEADPKAKEEAEKRAKLEFTQYQMKQEKELKLDEYTKDPLDKDQLDKLFNDIEMQREQDNLEFDQDPIFDLSKEKFDNDKFNAAFEHYKNTKTSQLTNYTGPTAFNNLDLFNNNQFSDLSVYDNNRSTYTNLDYGPEQKLTKEQVNKIKVNKVKESQLDYKKEMEERLRQRELEDKQYENREFANFKTEPDPEYMFLHQTGADATALLDFSRESEADLLNLCDKLIELEKA